MSAGSENLELLREGTEAFNRGDLAFVVSRAADDIEVHADRGLMNAGDYQGREQFQKWMMEWIEAWREISIDIRKVEEIAGRFLIVEVHQQAVGSESGVPVAMDIVQLIEARDGEIVRFHLYPTREMADAALAKLL
ncbi:MAG: nuclear transport factor 2 family protein [Actinomycetota bacterium]|nr:nuclear transport factor 2 family protein [Actinomycetota bacterium]